jgi:hypothetical protein
MTQAIRYLDIVVLKSDLPAEGLEAGDVGTVVLAHEGGRAFEVEFSTLTGDKVSVVTLPVDAIRAVEPTDISHVRVTAPSP